MANVIFLHPDLGIGGAERLIVDAAVALKQIGYSVHMLTTHHDPEHCFEETKSGYLPVSVHGDWLPRTLFGYCYALCAYIRMIYLSFCLLVSSHSPDLIIIDQISIPIPLLKLKTRNIIFYCHFPDQLLSRPGGSLKTLYRKPLNWLEDYTTNQAKKIFVNSRFTARIVMNTFSFMKHVPEVLYPSLVTEKFDQPVEKLAERGTMFLSLNRFERKKNIALAVHAFKWMTEKRPDCRLVIAGGYDEILPENVEYFGELEELVDKLGLREKVELIRSPEEKLKIALIKSARCLIYTPENEHFGIVPIEAMYLETPVLAANSGGPLETVQDGFTGYLRPPNPKDFGQVLLKLHDDPKLARQMGQRGRDRVQDCFSFQEFSKQLDCAVQSVMNS